MAPQFVDFNRNGHIDIVTATFDGSPWVAYGTEKGFRQPQHILDKNGQRIYLGVGHGRGAPRGDRTGGTMPGAHCVSAVAFDWNGNGVLDLILGDRQGHLFVQINEGTNAEPKFAGVSTPIRIGDEIFKADRRIANPRFVDWDGDGLVDMVIGVNSDRRAGTNGGVMWLRNVGKPGEPRFEAPKVLIEFKETLDGQTSQACYIDVVDYNGNGRLDIVVGGYAGWIAPGDAPARERLRRVGGIWVYTQSALTGARKQ